jgi:hypothetical protein
MFCNKTNDSQRAFIRLLVSSATISYLGTLLVMGGGV